MPRMTKKDWGSHGPPGRDRASDKQMAFIERLTNQARVGTLASHGIKHVLGKNPIGGLTKQRASEVINALKAKANKEKEG